MKLKSMAANQTEVELIDGTIIFFSYETPVAAFVPGRGAVKTDVYHSRTTSKHINQAIARWGSSEAQEDQEVLEVLVGLLP